MSEIPASFSEWQWFKQTVTAFAKAFGSYHRLSRFRDVCIRQNPSVAEQHKDMFAANFKHICPSYTEHRWHYLYDTLEWIVPRRAALEFLKLDDLLQGENSSKADSEHSLSKAEWEMLRCMQSDQRHATLFWTMAGLCQQLAQWGKGFAFQLHSCPCRCKEKKKTELGRSQDSPVGGSKPSKPCPMIGRTGVLLASGLADAAICELRNITNAFPAHLTESVAALRTADPEQARKLMNDFQGSIGRIAFRAGQHFSYWNDLPWSLLMVMRPYVERFDTPTEVSWLS